MSVWRVEGDRGVNVHIRTSFPMSTCPACDEVR